MTLHGLDTSITTKSTKRLLGRIHRKFHDAPNHLRLEVYQTTVLPKLNYCCAVWDPHQVSYRSQLENIQKFAGRIVTKNWSLDYPSLCVPQSEIPIWQETNPEAETVL